MGSRTKDRVDRACESCRKRKRKCDGAKPKCSKCEALGRECKYEMNAYKRKPDAERLSKLTSEVTTLKCYIRQLEGKGKSKAKESPETPARDLPQEEELKPTSETSGRSAADEISFMLWRTDVHDNERTSWTGPSGNFCFQSSPLDLADRAQANTYNTRMGMDDPRITVYLSDFQLKHDLVELFIDRINPFHQLLSPSIVRSVVFSNSSDKPEALLRVAILAAASIHLKRADSVTMAQIFSSAAETLVLDCCRYRTSITVLQALTILCWHELAMDRMNMAWMYNCMSGSLVCELGLHVVGFGTISTTSMNMINEMEMQESRVRTFWPAILLDRIAGSLYGRPCVTPYHRVKTPFLMTYLRSTTSFEELVFNDQCRLWFLHDEIMDKIYSFNFSDIEMETRTSLLMKSRERLNNLWNEVDPRVRIRNTPSSLAFRCSYYTSLLLIHRPYLREELAGELAYPAMQTVKSAAISITQATNEFRKISSLSNAPFFLVHHVLTAAIVHLLGATSTDQKLRRQSVFQTRSCIEALDEMSKVWRQSIRAIKLLQQLADRWHVLFALPMRLSYPVNFSAKKLQEERKQNRPTNSEVYSSEPLGEQMSTTSMQNERTRIVANQFPEMHARGADQSLHMADGFPQLGALDNQMESSSVLMDINWDSWFDIDLPLNGEEGYSEFGWASSQFR